MHQIESASLCLALICLHCRAPCSKAHNDQKIESTDARAKVVKHHSFFVIFACTRGMIPRIKVPEFHLLMVWIYSFIGIAEPGFSAFHSFTILKYHQSVSSICRYTSLYTMLFSCAYLAFELAKGKLFSNEARVAKLTGTYLSYAAVMQHWISGFIEFTKSKSQRC